jgi:hypothetical protein
MKGQANPDTLTGRIQRALTDEFEPQAAIVGRCGQLTDSEYVNARLVLERLAREGRAESRFTPDHRYLSGGHTEYRRKQ